MFPSYGVGTNVLAEDGAVINQIGGNPTEIMNTFAPNTIYSDMGYEPLSDSSKVKQFKAGGGLKAALNDGNFGQFMGGGGGDFLQTIGGAITGEPDAGSKIGGGIGQAAGMAIGGPVGGMIGKFAGTLIGDMVDTSEKQIREYNKQSSENMGRIAASQAGVQFQDMFGLRRGGFVPKAQNGNPAPQGVCSVFGVPVMGPGKGSSEVVVPGVRPEEVYNKYYAATTKEQKKKLEPIYKTLVSEGKIPSTLNFADYIAAQNEADAINDFFTKDYWSEKFFDPANPTVPKADLVSQVPTRVQFYRAMVPNIGRKEAGRRNLEALDILNLMPVEERKALIGRGYRAPQQENGGQTSEYEWVSHTWQPQKIAFFGEHKLTDLLRPPKDADMLRAGGEIRNLRDNFISEDEKLLTNMALGGQLETTWGGYAEPISHNPYMPSTGQTVMFRGQSHDESDGKGRTGIGVKYGAPDSYTDYAEYGTKTDADVEVERNEPAVELPNGDGENSMVVYGNLKIPNQFLSEIGDPKAKGKKFKTYVKDLAKKEQRQNKIIDKSSEKLDNLDPNSPFDMLKFNSLAANIKGANMKLKQYADFKTNAAAVQNAINDTAEEMGLNADSLAKGKVMQAKRGANVPKAQVGRRLTRLEALGYVPKGQAQDPTTKLFGGVTIQDVEALKRRNPWYDWAGFDPSSDADVRAFQKAYNREAKKLGVKSDIQVDGDLGQQTVSAKALYDEDKLGPLDLGKAYKGFPELKPVVPRLTGPAPNILKTVTPPVKKNDTALINSLLGQAMQYLRPTDIEQLDPNQLIGEMFALSQNQVEPVWAQKLQPRLATPIDISLQDILNENRATLRRQQQMVGYNPAAQSAFAAQEYGANQRVLGEQFRLNQAEKQRVYEQNRNLLNQYDLTNLGILDKQYERQAKAESITDATKLAALNSMASKIAQNKLDNRTLQVYENLYNYRYDPNFRAQNFQLAQFSIPTVGSTSTSSSKTAKSGKKVEERNSSIVKALKNI
jgi:peptidoglycan hydrolase-like protein with peptidoglycan-binding domain